MFAAAGAARQLASERRRAEELRARMGNLGASPQTAKPSKPWVQEAFQQAESFQHINHSTAGADATKSYAALERERVQREREELDRKREEQVRASGWCWCRCARAGRPSWWSGGLSGVRLCV